MALMRKVQVLIYRHAPGLEVLLLKRAKKEKGDWHPVTGNLEPREMPRVAAMRETLEETGFMLEPEPLGYTFTYELTEGPRVGRFHETVFAVKAPEDEEPELSEEHEAFEWVPVADARARLAWPEQQKALDLLVARYARNE